MGVVDGRGRWRRRAGPGGARHLGARAPARALALAPSVLLVSLSGLVGPGVAAGQGSPAPEPAPTTTTTTAPEPVVGPEPEPPSRPGAAQEESAAEPVPTEQVVIPPAVGPGGPPPPEAQRKAQLDLARRQRNFDRLFEARSAESRHFETLLTETAALEARLGALDVERQRQEGRLLETRDKLKRLAVARYVATPVAPLNNALQAPNVVDLSRRFAMLGAVADADRSRVEDYVSAAREVTGEFELVSADLSRSRAELEKARAALQETDATLLASKALLVVTQTGGAVVTGALAFPVAGPHNFTDTFGAPRMFGTAFAHLHQGTDVFAAAGTPLVAIERGVLIRVGSDTLGGTKLWLVGATGTRYYYAHLSAFAPGVADGKPVQAGEVIGFVGSTGNAQGTSPHLHFEAHPDGGAAINPYPLLRIVQGLGGEGPDAKGPDAKG